MIVIYKGETAISWTLDFQSLRGIYLDFQDFFRSKSAVSLVSAAFYLAIP